MLTLDNPYQQGLSSDVVTAAVERIAAAASNLGAQLLVTQARASRLAAPHAEIRMAHEYTA
jgi:hypothetical protein